MNVTQKGSQFLNKQVKGFFFFLMKQKRSAFSYTVKTQVHNNHNPNPKEFLFLKNLIHEAQKECKSFKSALKQNRGIHEEEMRNELVQNCLVQSHTFCENVKLSYLILIT